LSDAAVSLTRTSFCPGVGIGKDRLVRSLTFDAVEGIVHAVFVAGADIMKRNVRYKEEDQI
jgi:hypothetical protein